MIVMNLELDNILGFDDFKINFSYPKKIINSKIESEHLLNKENFRYKKVNILIGTNASGKTSIGKALMSIFNFLSKKESSYIIKTVNNTEKKSFFSIDFVLGGELLYRVKCWLEPIKNIENNSVKTVVKLDLFSAKIWKTDSYETAIKRIKKININSENYTDTLENLNSFFGWLFTYPEEGSNFLENLTDEFDLKIFENIMKVLDNSVKKITKINDKTLKNTYKLELKNKNLILQDGKFLEDKILSSGTKSGIAIASLVASIKKNLNGFYYCDEKFSYIHTDIEKSILSLMISFLKPNTQLFFTTHNLDVLDLDLPLHSFTFLKKDKKIEAIYPTDYLKKNDTSLKSYVKNDIFNIAPNLEMIYELG